jgi:NifU-like protein involved in Fe-S cluster formation
LEELHDRLTGALSGGVQSGDIEVLKPLLGVQPYPARIRCATLPWSAGIKALSSPKSLKN